MHVIGPVRIKGYALLLGHILHTGRDQDLGFGVQGQLGSPGGGSALTGVVVRSRADTAA